MSKQLLIDTQALLWWVLGSAKLSEPARSEMQIRLEAAETLLVSSWSIVELVYSTEKPVGNAGRVEPNDLDVVVEALLDPEHGFEIVPVDASVALRVRQISRDWTTDPGDRTIIATSLVRDATLVTSDTRHRFKAELDTLW